ncbi:helix-turn-helix domain-containing protein [Saccharopolyspora sp. NPDC047091]|uniref:TetR/AcrR family transcriptional regulator n=1 Tax=Saccharopolyspora sp. NPDC047091 TaxID=3155924 RepID=UPI0033E0A4CE
MTAPRRTRLSREARAAQLLDTAEALFAEHGLERTSVEDVARAAGVTRPMVYSHFASKEEIFLACVRRARAELEARIREPEIMIEAGADAAAVIERAGALFFELLERDPQRWKVLFLRGGALSEDLAADVAALRLGTVRRIADMIGHFASFDEERATAFAHAISGVGEQLGRWWFAHPEIPRDRVVAHYRDFITAGLGLP